MEEHSIGASAKTCIACHQDCSNRPRIKDAHGRYMCKQCAQARAQRAPQAVAVAAPEPALTNDAFGLEEIGIAPEEVVRPTVLPPQSAPAETRDPKKHPAKKKSKASTWVCKNCGYDMRGLGTYVCPECGTTTPPKSGRDEALQQLARDTRRNAFLRPVIAIVVGLVVVGIVLAVRSSPPSTWIIAYGSWIVTVPLCFGAMYLCQIFGVELDAPWYLNLLGMAGAAALTLIPWVLFYEVPGGWIARNSIQTAVWVIACYCLLEMELWESIVVGCVTSLFRAGVVFALIMIVLSL